MLTRKWKVAIVAAAAVAVGGMALYIAPTAFAATTLNVKDYGATGNGSTNDTAAINKAIVAANATSGGATVEFPSGTYKSANTIHMLSNVTLQFDAGATLMGASGTGYDKAESNSFDQYQDYGHSHFHDAMIYGDRLTNIGFTGAGTIDGGGHLITGNPGSGEADKIISLTRCDGLKFDGLTMRHGGHFAVLINGCNNVTANNFHVLTSTDRDAWNIISTTNVTIQNSDIQGNDDAIVFKSDYALGQKLPNGHVHVTNTHASAGCCNALMFGSETCGDFTDYNFDHITITSANKSGLGMVSMDGANISDVHYSDITVSGVASPIMEKIGTRRRCGNSPGIGHISNITYDNITLSGKSSPEYSPTIWGQSGGNQISDITFNNVNITVPGGHGSTSTGVPSDNGDYNPNSIGTRPAYGWYIHNANHITFNNSSVRFSSGDARPAVIANTASLICFNRFTAQRSTGSQDMIFQSVNGYYVSPDSLNTSGGALRVSQTGSTQATASQCGSSTSPSPTPSTSPTGPPPPPNRFEAESGTCAGTIDSNHAGFSGTGFCNTDNAVGSTLSLPVTVASAGAYKLTVHFANGTTADRPMSIAVNGSTVAANQSFPVTANWDTWADATVTANLSAGSNTVLFTSTTAGGGPNIDYVDVNPTVALTRVEAESGTCDGTIDSDHAGFSGTGFCNTTNAVGSTETLTLNAASAGPAQVRIHFANGTTADRPMSIAVNGTTAIASQSFPVTTNWDTWADATVTLNLNAGANTVVFTSTTAGGGPNLDYVEF
jgi:polygalacturonase